jgi:hypothetical protein
MYVAHHSHRIAVGLIVPDTFVWRRRRPSSHKLEMGPGGDGRCDLGNPAERSEAAISASDMFHQWTQQ